MLDQWPTTFPPPKPTTLWTWVNQAFERGLVLRERTGHRTDPHRFYLPEKMADWMDDPMYQFGKLMRDASKHGMPPMR